MDFRPIRTGPSADPRTPCRRRCWFRTAREEPGMSIFATLGAYAGLLMLVLMSVTPMFADREF